MKRAALSSGKARQRTHHRSRCTPPTRTHATHGTISKSARFEISTVRNRRDALSLWRRTRSDLRRIQRRIRRRIQRRIQRRIGAACGTPPTAAPVLSRCGYVGGIRENPQRPPPPAQDSRLAQENLGAVTPGSRERRVHVPPLLSIIFRPSRKTWISGWLDPAGTATCMLALICPVHKISGSAGRCPRWKHG